MEKSEEKVNKWSQGVEDLVRRGDVEGALSLLESVVSDLETLGLSSSPSSPSPSNLLFAGRFSDLCSFVGPSLRDEELRSRALQLRTRLESRSSRDSERLEMEKAQQQKDEEVKGLDASDGPQEEEADDWEALADSDLVAQALHSSKQDATSMSLSQVGSSPQETPKRRGRGSFLYQKSCLYSDQSDAGTTSSNNSGSGDHRQEDEDQDWNFGTTHVLVIYDFPVTTRTTDLEKLFDKFHDVGFAIRWIDDTTALAVFRTPTLASEAQSCIHSPYKVRKLDEDDDLLAKISRKDLEPPVPRPKTSARTARRLIAHGMGLRLPSDDFGSEELRKQEEERKKRILDRQSKKDDAWGSD